MKFIITESKLKDTIEKFISDKSKREFDWVDKIEIVVTSTLSLGWKRDFPVYQYLIYVNTDKKIPHEQQSIIYDLISSYHVQIFNSVGSPNVYFSTNTILPNGESKLFPNTYGESKRYPNNY